MKAENIINELDKIVERYRNINYKTDYGYGFVEGYEQALGDLKGIIENEKLKKVFKIGEL